MEKKFVASVDEVNKDTDILIEDIGTKGYSYEEIMERAENTSEPIHIIGDNKQHISNAAAVLNEQYSVERGLVSIDGSNHNQREKVAYGADKRLEAVSTEDTAKAAIENVMSETKNSKEMVTMTNKTVEMNNKGVSDKEATQSSAAKKFLQRRSAEAKNAQGSTKSNKGAGNVKSQIKNRVAGGQTKSNNNKEEKEMNKTENSSSVTRKIAGAGEEKKGQVGRKAAGQNKGGNEMNTQTKDNRKPSRRLAGGQGADKKASVVRANKRMDWDESVRATQKSERTTTPWYLQTKHYPVLERLDAIIADRKDAELGIESINLLNPNDENVIPYQDHNYVMVVEIVFGGGLNIRFRISENESEYSNSNLKSSNIKWRTFGRDITPVYAFARRNTTAFRVKCECSKYVDVYEGSRKPAKCDCGKEYTASGEFTVKVGDKAVHADNVYLGDYTPQFMDNFNIQVDKNVLALAMAFAQYAWGYPMHGVVETEDAE